MTHYIPAFTKVRGTAQYAVCGVMIQPSAHSTEPTCPVCQTWIEGTASEDEATAKALEAEFPEFKGRLVSQ